MMLLTRRPGTVRRSTGAYSAAFLLPVLFVLTPLVRAGFRDHPPVYINPGEKAGNGHFNSGGRRIVRIDGTTIALSSVGSEDWTYRSTDNGGSWERIDSDGYFSGCLVTGPDSMVYHFYRRGDNLYMIKFKYNQTPPEPRSIYTEANLAGEHGVYDMVNATVDREGVLYLSAHWNPGTAREEDLYVIRSSDNGGTWNPSGSAFLVREGGSDHSWGYIHMDVTWDNRLVCVYSEWGSYSVEFAVSDDKGESWKATVLADANDGGKIYNPAVLPAGNDALYVFAQSQRQTAHGLVFTKSTDSGDNWGEWREIDGASSSGYADPSPALAANGDIYVAYRSGARSDLADVSGGAACRERLARSQNGGESWTFPDDYFYDAQGDPTERTGTRSQTRYQTWWNYGGPLEWIWLQEFESTIPTMYDVNEDVHIKSLGAAVTGYRMKPVGSGERAVLACRPAGAGAKAVDLLGRSTTLAIRRGARRRANGVSGLVAADGSSGVLISYEAVPRLIRALHLVN